MADRWKVARLLGQDISYRKINQLTGISTSTITRVARSLTLGKGGYQQILSQFTSEPIGEQTCLE
jgi:TrpR-related protein YerC/YecD